MKGAILVLVAILAVALFPAVGLAKVDMRIPPSACFQDQYGNQYNFQIDAVHQYFYGEVIMAQPCDAPIWPLTGSFAKTGGGIMLELTAANPLGENDTVCVTTYKVKGIYPNAEWYYDWGYGAQPFTWTFCGTPVSEDNTKGGILRNSVAVEKPVGITRACLQDQYGNMYDFQIDAAHQYLYGVMISAQGCDAPIWPLTGSYARTADGPMLELTAANPLGDYGSCITTAKVKGTYPNAAWYYIDGYGGQEFTWIPCIP